MTEHGDHEHTHEPGHIHEHVDFEPASMVSSRLCGGCGSYVNTLALEKHRELHDRLARIEHELARLGGNFRLAAPEEFQELSSELSS